MDEACLRSCLTQDCELVVLASTTSTNDELARRLRERGGKSAPDPLLPPLVVVSAEQKAGRGRLGRTWVSPQGGIYLSVGLPVPGSSADKSLISTLSPLTALAVRAVLAGFSGDKPLIKWPNDVHSSDGKLSGILVELKGSWAVVGVGINVNRPVEGAFEGSSYLSDTTTEPLSLEEVAAAVVNNLLAYYRSWQSADYSFAPFVSLYQEHMALLGEWISVWDNAGEEVASGVVQGVDSSARLLLVGPAGTAAIFAGEITLRGE